MIRTSIVLSSSLIVSAALAHNHITIDTASGSPGDKITIHAGYYPTETMFVIDRGRLTKDGLIACYPVPDQFPSGPSMNWYGGDELLLTSDFYFPTGRLVGGDFRWEIKSITPVLPGSTQLVWGDFDEGGNFTPMAASDGATRSDRSFATPAGNHNHEQGYAFENAGLFDVTFVVWDAAAIYTDSDSITIRFRSGPPCPADLNADGVVDDSDFVYFVQAYNILDCADPSMPSDCPSDLTADGVVDDSDFVVFVQAYNTLLCP